MRETTPRRPGPSDLPNAREHARAAPPLALRPVEPTMRTVRARDQLAPVLVVVLLAAMILVPKVGGVTHVNDYLWGEVHGARWTFVLAQDLVLLWLLVGPTLATLRAPSWTLFLGWWLLLATMVAMLAIDIRVRVMWLKPLDYEQTRYFFSELASIRSSVGSFFDGPATFGISCRRLFFATGVVFAGTFGLALLDRLRNVGTPLVHPRVHALTIAWPFVFFVGLGVCARVPKQLYSLEDTLVVRGAVHLLRAAPAEATTTTFEQPPRPMREALAAPRVRLAEAAPFENVVVVLLESFRFRGFAFPSSPVAPNLSRFAREGLWAKAYVAVPHSSKGLYASIAGRYPTSCVEIHEAKPRAMPTVFRDLRDLRHATTTVFSAPYLRFENTEGLLDSAGFDHAYGPDALESLARRGDVHFSYGTDDRVLAEVPARVIAEDGRRPFATLLLTINAHHPYLYPDKPSMKLDGIDEYHRAIRYTDAVLGDIVRSFDVAGLADGTLFVFVGDHGESFREHGVTLHNNSLFEEEITVPLVFWAKDGRLRHEAGLEARQIDIAPTIADLVGLEGTATPTQGVSLLRAESRPPAFVATFFDGVAQALVLDDRKYLYYPSSGRLSRFDRANDPDERFPIAVSGAEADSIVERLRAAESYEAFLWETSR